jgi:hypothetical protein
MVKTLCADDEALDLFHRFVHCGLTGVLPSPDLLCAAKLVAIPKRPIDAQASLVGSLRPIAIGEAFYRVLGKFALTSLASAALPFLSPTQYGLFLGGGPELVVHLVRGHLAAHPDWGVLQLDLSNAFNTISRRLVLDTVRFYFPGALPLVQWAYGSATPLLYHHYSSGELFQLPSVEGVRQGCALGSLLFAAAQQIVLAQLPSFNLFRPHLFALHDDNLLVGPPDLLLRAYEEYMTTFSRFNLRVNPDKCHLYLPPGVSAPVSVPFAVTSEGIDVLSIPVGSASYIRTQMDAVITSKLLVCAPLVALPSAQLGLLLLRSCVASRIHYWLRCLAPTADLLPLLRTWDAKILETLLQILRLPPGFSFPSPVAYAQLEWPVKLGGLGFPTAVTLWPSVFVASVVALTSHVHDSRPDFPLLSYPGFMTASELWSSSFRPLFLEDTDPALDTLSSLPETYVAKFERRLRKAIIAVAHPPWLATLPANDRIRMQSLSAKGASAWLRAIPAHAGLTLSDDDFQLAILIRLGCPPHAPLMCKCDVYHGLTPDLTHPLGCHFRGRAYQVTRHDIQLPIVHRLLRKAGWVSRLEPRHSFDDAPAPPPDARRPDIEAFLGDRGYTFDLCIPYPLAPTYRAADGSSRALSHFERVKMTKYAALSAAAQLTFMPLVVDVFGGLGPQFKQFLQLVASHLSRVDSAGILSAFYQEFSVHLQRSNARWVSSGLRSHRVRSFNLRA